jgi:hypothetical protein
VVVAAAIVFSRSGLSFAQATNGQPANATESTFAAADQAKKAGVACQPAIGEMTRLTVDAAHKTVSLWNKETPTQRSFTALNFLGYDNQKTAPRALSFFAVTPTSGNHCDSNNFRIQPSSLSCSEIAANLSRQKNPDPTTIGDSLLYPPNAAGQRIILMPTATTGCVVVSTGAYYGP